MRHLILPCLIILLQLAFPADGAAASLDKDYIHKEYNDGNFDVVIQQLKAFQNGNSDYSLEDSIFIAKHLAVVYTANPESVELGKYYMHVLLQLVPKAELLDMFVSEEIDRIFQKVRREFMLRQESFGVDSSQISSPESPPALGSKKSTSGAGTPKSGGAAPPKKNRSPVKIAAWTGAGIAVAGVVAWFLLHGDSDNTSTQNYVIKNGE